MRKRRISFSFGVNLFCNYVANFAQLCLPPFPRLIAFKHGTQQSTRQKFGGFNLFFDGAAGLLNGFHLFI